MESRKKELDNPRICLCHEKGTSGKRIRFTDSHWLKFKGAACKRLDTIATKMKDLWEYGPFGYFHVRCYQHYISAGDVANQENRKRVRCKIVTSVTDAEMASPQKKKVLRSQIKSTDEDKCIICQKTKYKNDKKNLEPINPCPTFTEGKLLYEAANVRQNERIKLFMHGKDPVNNVHYHRTCYKVYTSSVNVQAFKTKTETENKYDKAFHKLSDFISDRIIHKLEVYRMTQIRDKHLRLLREQGIESDYRSDKLIKRLSKQFPKQLEFYEPQGEGHVVIVFASRASKGYFAKNCVVKIEEDEEDDELATQWNTDQDNTAALYTAAKCLRSELLKMEDYINWPPGPEDLTEDNIKIPSEVLQFITWTLTDTDLSQTIINDQRVRTRVLSICQDIVYNAKHLTEKKVKMPKHIALAQTVKNKTKSKELIKLLHKFGHCIRYDEIIALENELLKLQTVREQHNMMIPRSIKPHVFTVFCWDNNDLCERTLTGSNTTHVTNGIAIQRMKYYCDPKPKQTHDNITRECLLGQVLPYKTSDRVSPKLNIIIQNAMHMFDGADNEAQKKDLGWFVLRISFDDAIFSLQAKEQTIPGWKPFNMVLNQEDIPPRSKVGYCQVIDANPTEMPMVYTLLKHSILMADELGQQDVVVTLDQAIYAKAKEIVLGRPVEFKRIVLRMGAFHISCNLLGIIGKRFQNSGLKDVLIESLTVASGSIESVLNGHDYNRGVYAHKIMLEALLRLKWQSFGEYMQMLEQNAALTDNEMTELREEIKKLKENFTPRCFARLIDMPAFSKLQRLMDGFHEACKESKMAGFWLSYIELVTVLLNFIRSTREGSWKLHLQSISKMMPWMFAYDHINYARYLTVYYLDMVKLKETHPEAHEQFMLGEFAVQRSDLPFSQVPVDQTIEQTINRDSKTAGGIIGFSLNKSAVQRWVLTSSDRAAITQACLALAGVGDYESAPKESSPSRVRHDESCIIKIMSSLQFERNPFSPERITNKTDEIIHLMSGCVAPNTTVNDLKNAHARGYSEMVKFIECRIISNDVSFYATLKKLNLKTMASMVEKMKMSKDDLVKKDRDLYARLLVVAQNRSMDLRDIFSFELAKLPPSLCLYGSMNKMTKSKFMPLLEVGVSRLEDVPEDSVWIFDAMSIIHALKCIPDNFHQLAGKILNVLISTAGKQCTRIDFVGDRYMIPSIKDVERERRSGAGEIRIKILSPDQKCPKQWLKYLNNGQNKEELLKFLVVQWAREDFAKQLEGHIMYIGVEEQCFVIRCVDGFVTCDLEDALGCTQEEADTRLLLHSKHASLLGCNNIVIHSPDTDVEVIAVAQQSKIGADLFIHTKQKNFVHVQRVASQLGQDICEALPGLHAFTGSDTTSAFHNRGKQEAFRLVARNDDFCLAMQQLGTSYEVLPDQVNEIEAFTVAIYGLTCRSVNEARYILFCRGRGQNSANLPPTRSALHQHVKRANYQAAVWKSALQNEPVIPSPHKNGWIIDGDTITINWMTQAPAPTELLKVVKCSCKKTDCTKRCSCKSNGLSCNEMWCLCEKGKCQNREVINDNNDSSDDE